MKSIKRKYAHMNLRFLACLFALAMPLCANSQSLLKIMPSVARPGPGDRDCKKPAYPLASLRNDEQGVVTIQYLVDKDGAILDGKIVKSSGFFELDKAAFVGLAKCAFKISADMQEPVYLTVQYVWKLE